MYSRGCLAVVSRARNFFGGVHFPIDIVFRKWIWKFHSFLNTNVLGSVMWTPGNGLFVMDGLIDESFRPGRWKFGHGFGPPSTPMSFQWTLHGGGTESSGFLIASHGQWHAHGWSNNCQEWLNKSKRWIMWMWINEWNTTMARKTWLSVFRGLIRSNNCLWTGKKNWLYVFDGWYGRASVH